MNTLKKRVHPYLLLAIVYFAANIAVYWFFRSFADSGFFTSITTALVGSLALYVYVKQRTDEKVNAAISIINEIRSAENKIDIIINSLNGGNNDDLPSVLPTDTWKTYSHLFVKDFDSDELLLINSFYASCHIIEDFVNRQNNFFWVTTEERAKTAQQMLAKIHDDFQIEAREEGPAHPIAQQKFTDRKAGLTEYYSNEAYMYTPQKTLNVLKFQTQQIQKITTSTCGAKFKKIANF